jgi:hypothetical protein
MTAKPEIVYSAKFWRSKVERILIPYAIWTMIFFISRIIIFALTKKADRLQQLLQDPLSIIFFGGASYHLYFLPLLLTGTLLVLLIPLLARYKISTFKLLLIVTISTILYAFLEIYGNGFQLKDTSIAFENLANNFKIDFEKNPLLRFVSIEVAWIIRCLP